MTHALIIEVGLQGHHANYLRQSILALTCSFARITVVIESPEEHSDVVQELEEIREAQVRVRKLADATEFMRALATRAGLVGRELVYYNRFRKSFLSVESECAVDFVFLPYADYCLYAIGLCGSPFGSALWSGICMRPSFHYHKLGLGPRVRLAGMKRALLERALRSPSLVQMLTIDPTLPEDASRKSDRLAYLADPTDFEIVSGRSTAREILNLPNDAKVLLVYGAITPRKGIESLAKALADVPRSERICLLVVGRQSAEFARSEARRLLSELSASTSVVEINEVVDHAKEELAFASADAVWIGYDNHFTMSGVLVMAGKARRPVIATQDGLIGLLTRRWRLGRTVDVSDTIAIRRLLVDAASWRTSDPDLDAMSAHSWANFQTALRRLVADGQRTLG